MDEIQPGSLVLYKNRPARLLRTAERLEIELESGEIARVRSKDILLLHPGPLESLKDLSLQAGDIHTAWEILCGVRTSLEELAVLAYGSFTPATAWSAWQSVAEQLFFSGSPTDIRVHTASEVEQKQKARAQTEAEQQAWRSFIDRTRRGIFDPADRARFIEVENLALGRAKNSRLLGESGRAETPENAHALLLELGVWDNGVNPYPLREGVTLTQVDFPSPELPDEERLDLTRLPAYAMDDEGADTPDDALSLEGDRIWVHIADVAALAPPGSPIDEEARLRGMSLHLPEGVIHMLPRAVTAYLGLGLQEISPALSFGFDIDSSGIVRHFTIAPSRVRVQRLDYLQAESMMDEKPLRTMKLFFDAVRERRRENQAVMLNFPEIKLAVEDGRVTIQPILPLRSRALVEEAMILTGTETARFAMERGIVLPFSQQEEIGVADRPETLSGMFALRRFLKRAQFDSFPAPHQGLGVSAYTQVTSPLRRYLDLVAQQQIRAALLHGDGLDREQLNGRIAAFEAVAESVRRAELLSERHWTLVYLLQHPGWRGEGILVDKRGARGTVILPALALEAHVYLKHTWPLDQVLAVQLAGIDLPHQEASFMVVEER